MTASGSYRLFDQLIARLAHGLCEITIAIEHRQELTRLADHDDRMLADIGLSRSDFVRGPLRAFLGRPNRNPAAARETSTLRGPVP
jgi:uncharacterized protein YjiS (DUF1127 family)